MILIYGLIFLLIFSSIGIGLLIYSRRKKSKVGLIISIVMILLVILTLLGNTIDELTISKDDIIKDFKHINIELKDEFKITKNKVTGFPERIQETEIQITQKDKEKIISEIRNSINFKSYKNGKELTKNNEQYGTSIKIFNFRYPEFYSRRKYTEIDSFPTRLILSIYDNSNKIKYQRFED